MSDLFNTDENINRFAPLAERIRPKGLEGFVGQRHLVGEGKILDGLIKAGEMFSMVLWGPPGTGKTTLARILAQASDAEFVSFSAVLAGVKEVREVIAQAREHLKYGQKKTVLFVDEIHRFNKAQQDAFLPHVESGLLTLIGATTENPSFEIISALLSRMRVLVLESLKPDDLGQLLEMALKDEEMGLGRLNVEIDDEARTFLTNASDGDARAMLNTLELAVTISPTHDGVKIIKSEQVQEAMQKKSLRYDKNGEEHFNLISALHKCLRDSDPDAALYWLARMIQAGEDPVYILRRMVRFASEDIGMADPTALILATSALDSYRLIGSPEGDLALAHLAVYLAAAPKSNAIYKAYGQAVSDAHKFGSLPVPLVIRNAPTDLMKSLDYGKGYKYAHDYEDGLVDQEHMPEGLEGKKYYFPTDRGREKLIREKLEMVREQQAKGSKSEDSADEN